jgi:hypothetical protein
MKSRFLPVLALFFFCAAFLFPLDNGALTVINCPADSSVFVCENNAPESLLDLAGSLSEVAAVGLGDNPPFSLYTPSGEDFTATGTFLVIILVDSVIYFIDNVRFNNGSASVDFNKTNSQTSLPIF